MAAQMTQQEALHEFSISAGLAIRKQAADDSTSMGWYFAFFFISGFCSILYELIWLRLAMAQFGVTTALVSIVLSMFMAGLGAGSWASGILARRYGERVSFPPLRLYALAELLIGCSSLAVPVQLLLGRRLLESLTERAALSSATYYLASGMLVALIVIPWCACMGATIPLAMSAIRSDSGNESRRSFSFLYLSNVLGAVAGAIVPLFLIELYGFHGTLARRCGRSTLAIAASAFRARSATGARSLGQRWRGARRQLRRPDGGKEHWSSFS